MIIDVGNPDHWKPEWAGTRVLLDGTEVRCVFYADDVAGVVKTFDVLHDGTQAQPTKWRTKDDPSPWTVEDFPGRDVQCPIDSVLSETLRGAVTIIPPKGVVFGV